MTGHVRVGEAPLDQPVFIDHEPDLLVDEDARHRSAVGFVARTLLASMLLLATPFFLDVDIRPFGFALAFVYVPFIGAVDLALRRGLTGRTLATAPLIADIAALGAFGLASGSLGVVATTASVVVGFHTWNGGRVHGFVSALLLTGAMTWMVADTGRDARHDGFVVTMALATSLLLILLIDDQTRTRSAATRGFRLVSDRAEAILNGTGDAIVTTTTAGELQQTNAAAQRLLGVAPDHRRACGELLCLHDGLQPLDCSSGCGLLGLDGHETGVELWRRGVRGERQALLASAFELRDPGGETVEVIHSFRDISAIKAAEEAKTLFLATTSHELKTPLTVIRGFAQMLHNDAVPEESRKRAIAAIETRTTDLVNIVDRLLMTSRIEAGHVDVNPGLHDVSKKVRVRCDEMETATDRSIIRHVADDVVVWTDPDALTTVIDHLLENAVKYSPDGGDITVDVESIDDVSVLRVSDPGVGMTPEQAERCFERFWQAEGTDVRRFGGTGIGLYIVKSLLDAMHATITVESEPGRGTTFVVCLRNTAPAGSEATSAVAPADGESSVIREFMRQVGVGSGETR